MTIVSPLVATIPGHPAPKGSLRCIGGPGGRHRLIEDNKRTKPWRDRIVWAFRDTPKADPFQPIRVSLDFTLPAPQRRTRPLPVGRVGDVDKLARLALDALQDAGVLPDDAQVVELVARKTYDGLPWPGVTIRIEALP